MAIHDLLLRQTGQEDLDLPRGGLLPAPDARPPGGSTDSTPTAATRFTVGLPTLDRPRVLPRGVADDASDLAHANGTAWLAPHIVWMLELATTIASIDPGYEDMAVTFLDTAVTIIDALDAWAVAWACGTRNAARTSMSRVCRTAASSASRCAR